MPSKQLQQDIILLITAIFSVITLGAIIFHFLEGWTVVDAFYFVTMTATTVGYGDLVPSSPVSKVITILYALSIVPFVLYAFTAVAKSQIEKVYTKVHHLERKQKEQEEEIDAAERKLRRQKTLIKQQEEELDEQQANVKKQLKAIHEQEKELEEHDREIESQKRRMREQAKINKEQETEITEHDKELEVVENIMEKALDK
ncbi:potassium channel family protein [Patescibacteria group bacterium]|nr:potassium channel family protein [Patescibacteria group bacterium]MBU1016138.1 potassium channel family protein [Patescibacteria group bacterium]MBU1684704.1 potassium channel family protein [Patescibacteria group bacterium]MBU1938349.1 potassium channel family protein [Patescibacteria group bacterium]